MAKPVVVVNLRLISGTSTENGNFFLGRFNKLKSWAMNHKGVIDSLHEESLFAVVLWNDSVIKTYSKINESRLAEYV